MFKRYQSWKLGHKCSAGRKEIIGYIDWNFTMFNIFINFSPMPKFKICHGFFQNFAEYTKIMRGPCWGHWHVVGLVTCGILCHTNREPLFFQTARTCSFMSIDTVYVKISSPTTFHCFEDLKLLFCSFYADKILFGTMQRPPTRRMSHHVGKIC